MFNSRELPLFFEFSLGGAIVLWLDSVALIWLGMWKGLKAKKHPRAVLATLGQVMVLPWVGYFVIGFIVFEVLQFNEEEYIFFALCFLFGAVIDGLSIAYARKKLATEFRAIVARRYDG